jgi:hypothetical protein
MRAMMMGFVCAVVAGCGPADVKYTEGGGDPEGTDGDGGNDEGIAIAGTWLDSFGITNTITDESWGWQYPGYPDTSFAITQYDNDAGVAVVQDEIGNDMGEKLWGRFEWTFVDDAPYYCMTADSLESEDAAAGRASIDHGNVTANCNGYAWFELMPI